MKERCEDALKQIRQMIFLLLSNDNDLVRFILDVVKYEHQTDLVSEGLYLFESAKIDWRLVRLHSFANGDILGIALYKCLKDKPDSPVWKNAHFLGGNAGYLLEVFCYRSSTSSRLQKLSECTEEIAVKLEELTYPEKFCEVLALQYPGFLQSMHTKYAGGAD